MPRCGSSGLLRGAGVGSALAAYPPVGLFGLKGNNTLEFWKYVQPGGLLAGEPDRSGIGPDACGGGPRLDQEHWLSDGLAASTPRWNSQGTWVCYSRMDTLSGFDQIYQCHYGISSPEQRIVNMAENCEKPVYSPDGLTIVLQLEDTVSGFYQLCVTSTTGLGMRAGHPVHPQQSVSSISGSTKTDALVASPRGASVPSRSTVSAPGASRPGNNVSLGAVLHITSANRDHCNPEWSPNGQWLCYERDDDSGYTQIWRVSSLGGTEQQLTSDECDHFSPKYLNSNEIVYTSSPVDGYKQIAKVSISTHQITILSGFKADHERPDPSRNGDYVVAQAVDPSGNAQLVLISALGGSEIWLTNGNADVTSPVWCPDNQSIFGVRWTGVTSQIVYVDAVNGGSTPITDSSAIRDNPDASYDSLTAIAVAAYERQTWSPGILAPIGGWFKHGTGIYLSRNRHPHGGPTGTQTSRIVDLTMDNARPNPATSRVTLRWMVPVEANVSLCVYNTAGQLVKVLAKGVTKPGSYTSAWNGRDAKGRRLANGVYFCTLDNGEKRISRKVVLTD